MPNNKRKLGPGQKKVTYFMHLNAISEKYNKKKGKKVSHTYMDRDL